MIECSVINRNAARSEFVSSFSVRAIKAEVLSVSLGFGYVDVLCKNMQKCMSFCTSVCCQSRTANKYAEKTLQAVRMDVCSLEAGSSLSTSIFMTFP